MDVPVVESPGDILVENEAAGEAQRPCIARVGKLCPYAVGFKSASAQDLCAYTRRVIALGSRALSDGDSSDATRLPCIRFENLQRIPNPFTPALKDQHALPASAEIYS